MKKKFPSWAILTLICLAAAGVLGIVSFVTDSPIALRASEKAFAARQEAFASANEFAEMELPKDSSVDACYQALKDGELVGYVVQLTVSGCQGPIEIQAGFDLDAKIQAISCGGANFSETSGLGAKVKEPAFRDQFAGLVAPLSLGKEIDSVTGASVSSGAVVSGVNTAGYFVKDLIAPSAALNLPEDTQFGGVLPGAKDKQRETAPDGIDELYSSNAGAVAYVTGQGRNGTIQVQVGVANSGQIAGVYIDPAKHSETEGLGDAIENSYFRNQFLSRSAPFVPGDNIDAISGATISSTAVIDCVNRAAEAVRPYLNEDSAFDISTWFADGDLPVVESGTVKKTVKADVKPITVKKFSGVTVMKAEDWAEKYPNEYSSYLLNSRREAATDYVEDYPMIGKIYEGMAFNTYYSSARGHSYTVTDITGTGRPHKLANCFTCKSPDYTAMVNNLGDAAYAMPFEDVQAKISEPISCYNCHANTGDELVITHTYLSDALGRDLSKIDAADLSCGQCHVEYYFSPASKATVLPYTSLDTMTPDAILSYYNNTSVDGQPFADYTNPRTGVRQIKVQHPEFETFLGEGGVHRADFTCADCHMPNATAADGAEYKSHYLISPLENESLLSNTCSECHADIKAEVRKIQTETERRTYSIGYELELLTDKLAAAVENGGYSEEELNAIRALARDAQFYWDFVFVENSEGAHNSALSGECLDKAETLVVEALGMFR